ncbi:hypothetical protein PHYSODRAFT_257049 [Phytophthora sojae]|uniref:Uncharacterized protein n=1 Tax=Phytophthora sojae (strain P6497) TaxID=1094619 RepID=G4YX22_PHYSP|nr:hypothetical protein PHYSODRAFT_257049 [Phytophthora sojae]EGZ25029.1 hypothetical protein PHYSODRAFT_257049 [Phytophthora sojae]|eukprot:XP_009520317.1 hypothetical protein PHYSODRAFT_257049 [Phytophthora sojae]
MAGARNKKDGGRGDGGRGDGGRGEATRQSRRTQGLPAEPHKDLDVINREARARRKAERDVKEAEDKAKSTESAAQDDQVSTEAAEEEDLRSKSKAERIPERQAQATESAKASEGGADVGEPPAADRVSDSPQPEPEEETAKDVPVKVKAEVIEIEESDAEERSALEDAEVSSRSPQTLQSLNADVRPSLGVGAETADTTQLDETAAKNFVARQVYRWEQMRSGRVVPPSVEYGWPNPRPDFSASQEATMATSDYLRRRMALENRDAAWIGELRPERRVLGIAQDLTAVAIPPSMMSSRECAAVLGTLLFEAGFEFVNAVPDWFMTHASKINPGYVRSVVEEVQQLLTIELIEWKQLTAGVSFKVVPASDTKPAFKEEKTQDAQAVKDDLLMDGYEVELLGILNVYGPPVVVVVNLDAYSEEFADTRKSECDSIRGHYQKLLDAAVDDGLEQSYIEEPGCCSWIWMAPSQKNAEGTPYSLKELLALADQQEPARVQWNTCSSDEERIAHAPIQLDLRLLPAADRHRRYLVSKKFP